VLGAECTVVTVECRRRPVTHVAGLVVDAVGRGGHDGSIDVDNFALRHNAMAVQVTRFLREWEKLLA
jgi:hypothetical protein